MYMIDIGAFGRLFEYPALYLYYGWYFALVAWVYIPTITLVRTRWKEYPAVGIVFAIGLLLAFLLIKGWVLENPQGKLLYIFSVGLSAPIGAFLVVLGILRAAWGLRGRELANAQ